MTAAAQAATRTATRHFCSLDISPRCTKGDGKGPATGKCRHCGGKVYTDHGLWGVFTWTGTGRYPVTDAKRTYVRQGAAESWATANGTELVVRWIPS
jgi:hypothetical protein